MSLEHLIAAGLITAGSLFMVWSILAARRISNSLIEGSPAMWNAVRRLMYFFLGGYFLFIILLLRSSNFPDHTSDLLSGVVFFSGSVFVFLIIKVSSNSLFQVQARKEDLKGVSVQLQQKNEALEKEIE